MVNLYKEIINELKYHNKTIEDVKYISIDTRAVDIDAFLEVAKITDYDAGYGGIEVNDTLMIIGEDWWFERDEYDGSEWFSYKEYPLPCNADDENDRENNKEVLIDKLKTY